MRTLRRTSSRKRSDILSEECRCIYCNDAPDTVEHMPPVWFFEKRIRLNGYEYAACKSCNSGTRAADMATGFLARIRPFHGDMDDPLLNEAIERIQSIDQLAPGLREELFDNSPFETGRIKREGKTYDVVRIHADGPIVAGLLTTFGAKLGMALYREHVGTPLPMAGAVYVQPFFNGGLTQQQADQMLEILPAAATLRQGKQHASEQFSYAYNSDKKSIVMALASVQQNLHFLILATSDPQTYDTTIADRFVAKVAPGELLLPRAIKSLKPRGAMKMSSEVEEARRPFILPGLPTPKGWAALKPPS